MATHGVQGDPQNRVICAHCRANNFAGQAQCWQCHAPLSAARGGAQASPPYPAPRPPQVAVPTLPAYAQPPAAGRPSTARPSALLLVGVGMMTFVIVLIFNMRSPSGPPTVVRSAPNGIEAGRSVSDPTGDINAGQAGGGTTGAMPETATSAASETGASGAIPAAGNGTTASPTPGGGDPLEDAAKRVITREAPNVGLPPPGAASADGQVHLRSGGSISVEEWNAAKRKLQDNPLLKEPPAPPPF